MNLFDSIRGIFRPDPGAAFLQIGPREEMMGSAAAVFGSEALNWAKACVQRMDGEPQSDHRIGTALMALHKARCELAEAAYGYVPIRPSEEGCWNSPSDIGRRSVANTMQLELAREVFMETAAGIVGKHPQDEKVRKFFNALVGSVVRAAPVTDVAALKVKQIIRAAK
ncbi:hypothetical protein [Caballeronia sordidicola]|nr:hypothetical protein [Caballeronia sordidicola]